MVGRYETGYFSRMSKGQQRERIQVLRMAMADSEVELTGKMGRDSGRLEIVT